MITEQIRDEIFSSASPVQEWLYASGNAGTQLFSIAEKYDLHKDREVYKKFAVTVGDIILGFYRVEDTVPLLQQELGIDPKTSALLGAGVLEFLAPLSDPNWKPPVSEDILNENVPQGSPVEDTGGIQEHKIVPAAPSNEDEPTYTSHGQEDLRRPISETPSYTDTDTGADAEEDEAARPQWGGD